MSLVQWMYASSCAESSDVVFNSILESSRRNNKNSGITGILFFSDGHFLQVLEGETQDVLKTYGRIAQDPRHSNIVLLLQHEIERRDFDGWTMGWRTILPTDLKGFPQYAQYFTVFPDGININARPGIALEMLEAFSQ